MLFHNNYNLPKLFIELNKVEKVNVKLIKRKIRKEYGIRKTKIVKTIKFNEIYILLVNDRNNKCVDNSEKTIFKWEKYNLHKSKYVVLDTIINTFYNNLPK